MVEYFTLADKLPPDSVLLKGMPVVTASREHSDPTFCSQIEATITNVFTQLGYGVVPNPRFFLPEPYRQQDITSRMLDLLVTLPETGMQGLLEIDGERWHRDRKPQDAKRDRVLKQSGIKFIKRVGAAHAFHNPYGVCSEFIEELKGFWDVRGPGVSEAVHR